MAKLALTIGIISILILATFAFRSEPSFDRLAGRVERARMLPEESRAELQKLLERIRATAAKLAQCHDGRANRPGKCQITNEVKRLPTWAKQLPERPETSAATPLVSGPAGSADRRKRRSLTLVEAVQHKKSAANQNDGNTDPQDHWNQRPGNTPLSVASVRKRSCPRAVPVQCCLIAGTGEQKYLSATTGRSTLRYQTLLPVDGRARRQLAR